MAQESSSFYMENIIQEMKNQPKGKTITISRVAMNTIIRSSQQIEMTNAQYNGLVKSHKRHISHLKEQIRTYKARAAYYEIKYKELKNANK